MDVEGSSLQIDSGAGVVLTAPTNFGAGLTLTNNGTLRVREEVMINMESIPNYDNHEIHRLVNQDNTIRGEGYIDCPIVNNHIVVADQPGQKLFLRFHNGNLVLCIGVLVVTVNWSLHLPHSYNPDRLLRPESK
jgi:hypothetical protein